MARLGLIALLATLVACSYAAKFSDCGGSHARFLAIGVPSTIKVQEGFTLSVPFHARVSRAFTSTSLQVKLKIERSLGWFGHQNICGLTGGFCDRRVNCAQLNDVVNKFLLAPKPHFECPFTVGDYNFPLNIKVPKLDIPGAIKVLGAGTYRLTAEFYDNGRKTGCFKLEDVRVQF
ncbi:uncharacterized protein [Clytia hemisphaerica]|uniref:MD-2-related lipid-recognition domain-containing protein n=1 Tax=Clytia hemisphaerica TaxID=252671 RepID=A0A7M5TX63_9CNID|eukprot:TCONS_00013276-protein